MRVRACVCVRACVPAARRARRRLGRRRPAAAPPLGRAHDPCACLSVVKQKMGGFFVAADAAADGELAVEGGELPIEVVASESSECLAISHSLKKMLSSSCTFYEPEVVLQYLTHLRQRSTASEQARMDGGCGCAARRFPARGCANGSSLYSFS